MHRAPRTTEARPFTGRLPGLRRETSFIRDRSQTNKMGGGNNAELIHALEGHFPPAVRSRRAHRNDAGSDGGDRARAPLAPVLNHPLPLLMGCNLTPEKRRCTIPGESGPAPSQSKIMFQFKEITGNTQREQTAPSQAKALGKTPKNPDTSVHKNPCRCVMRKKSILFINSLRGDGKKSSETTKAKFENWAGKC